MKNVKKKIAAVVVATIVLCGCTPSGLSGMGGSSGTAKSGSAAGSILSSILGAATNGNTIVNALTSVLGMDKIIQKTLVGTWSYSGPGCAFTTEKTLAKAGGELAATKVKEKLLPIYQKVGLSASNTQFTFKEDNTFTAKIAGKSFSGSYTFDESDGKVQLKGLLLSITCYVKRASGGIGLLFESKKVLTLFQTLAALSGNSTAEGIGEISKNFDGVCMGFELKK